MVDSSIPIADGTLNTANGHWVVCTEEHILMFDMVRRSGMSETAFLTTIETAWEDGYTPKMWIVNEENDGENPQAPPTESG